MHRSIEQGLAKRPEPRPPTADQLAFLAAEPRLDFGEATLCRAYHELSTCRAVGMTLGPVPWLAMHAWAVYHELDRTSFDLLVDVLRRVDAETLRRHREAPKT